ncbi:MAG: FKBP-type peptidyl-prolyl cis-trans isomerase [Salibacteraceae bacterium]
MKTITTIILCLAISFSGFSGGKKKKGKGVETQKMELKTELDSLSYSLGISIANNLKSQGVDSINVEAMAEAMKHVYAGTDTIIDVNKANEIINTYFQGAVERKAAAAKKEGADFLAANSKKDGVVTLPSGLQYKIVKEGTGEKPTAADKVTTHYHGTLIDGTVFDSSVDRGQPASFPVGGVIKGWQEALQLMPVGSKWTLYVPYDLAYGDRGAGQQIGPYSALVFEVELISIDKGE